MGHTFGIAGCSCWNCFDHYVRYNTTKSFAMAQIVRRLATRRIAVSLILRCLTSLCILLFGSATMLAAEPEPGLYLRTTYAFGNLA